jgi:hypothetical protein
MYAGSSRGQTFHFADVAIGPDFSLATAGPGDVGQSLHTFVHGLGLETSV